eukprot:176597-Pleurochrysis_carterae.AAC.4
MPSCAWAQCVYASICVRVHACTRGSIAVSFQLAINVSDAPARACVHVRVIDLAHSSAHTCVRMCPCACVRACVVECERAFGHAHAYVLALLSALRYIACECACEHARMCARFVCREYVFSRAIRARVRLCARALANGEGIKLSRKRKNAFNRTRTRK